VEGRTARIIQDLPTLTGKSFESLIRVLLTSVNSEGRLPFRFSRISGYWNRTGDIEIDVVAFSEDSGDVLWGESKLNGIRDAPARDHGCERHGGCRYQALPGVGA